jgi:hypothetical protein
MSFRRGRIEARATQALGYQAVAFEEDDFDASMRSRTAELGS